MTKETCTRASCSLMPWLLILPALLMARSPLMARVPTTELRSATAMVDGHAVHYRIGGSGPCLLMLHGFTLTGEQWLPFATDFTASHTVIIADLPGHGGSSPLPGAFSFARAAQLLHGFLDELGVEQVRGLGHSGGGMTLLHMATQQPERFAGLILVASPHEIGAEGRKLAREDTWDVQGPELQRYYLSIHPGGQAQVDRIFAQYHGLANNLERIAPETLAALPVPTLLVWGDRDPFLPLAIPFEMYQALPHAALWVVPNQGHAPLWPDFGGEAAVATRFVEVAKQFWAQDAEGWVN